MKYWHCNFACPKPKLGSVQILRNHSGGDRGGSGLTGMTVCFEWVCWIMIKKKHTPKIGVTKWSPLPLFINPSPLPQFWEVIVGGGSVHWEFGIYQIANFSTTLCSCCDLFFFQVGKKMKPCFPFWGRHKFLNVPKICSVEKITWRWPACFPKNVWRIFD